MAVAAAAALSEAKQSGGDELQLHLKKENFALRGPHLFFFNEKKIVNIKAYCLLQRVGVVVVGVAVAGPLKTFTRLAVIINFVIKMAEIALTSLPPPPLPPLPVLVLLLLLLLWLLLRLCWHTIRASLPTATNRMFSCFKLEYSLAVQMGGTEAHCAL